jgi:hypothetical protein
MARAVMEWRMFLNEDEPLELEDRLDKLVSQHWLSLASVGWRGYSEHGRGFVCVQQNITSNIYWEGSVSYSIDLGGLDSAVQDTANVAVSNYEPDEEIVVCFEPLNGTPKIVAFRSKVSRPSEAKGRELLPC